MTPTPSSDEIYRAVRTLLNDLPPEMRARAAALLRQAENGQKTDNALLRLLRQDAGVYRQLQRLLQSGETPGETLGTRGYTPPAGEPGSIPASQEWVCPHPGCSETRPVIQAGEDPPDCPTHGVPMVLAAEKG